MKTKIILLFVTMMFLASINGCKKNEDSGKTGQITFSGSYWSKDGHYIYSVSINGKTGTCDESYPAPACGTISDQSVNFTFPAGTYTFTFTRKILFNGVSSNNESFVSSNSATIPEGGCVSVRWED
ncbi:MAG: hypothetical protein WCS03_10145 [Bacteroidota bacterium]